MSSYSRAWARVHGHCRAHARGRCVSAAGLIWASLMIGGVLVWQPAPFAFSSAADEAKYSIAADSVSLQDDDHGTAMFGASRLKPGSSGEKCIVVSSPTKLVSTVKLYATGYRTTNGLGDHINLVIDEGTGGSFGSPGSNSCEGFSFHGNDFRGTLSAFAAAKKDFASGVGGWAPQGSVSRTYRFTFNLDLEAPNSAQSGTASAGLTWEQQAW